MTTLVDQYGILRNGRIILMKTSFYVEDLQTAQYKLNENILEVTRYHIDRDDIIQIILKEKNKDDLKYNKHQYF